MPDLKDFMSDSTHARGRGGLHATVALMLIGIVACSDSGDSAGPPTPGAIRVTTETLGFLQGESYQLHVDGVSEGTIDANGEMTISGLDPASYSVDLGEVPGNCSVESITVTVESGETAEAYLSVVCAHAEPVAYTIQFGRERPKLDTGEVTVCPFSICSQDDEWDLYVHNSSQVDPQPIIRQNQNTGVEIAHVPDVVLDDLTEAHFEEATFSTELVDDVFDSGRVILIRTDLGNVFALGNPVVDAGSGTLSFDAALIAEP
jgi:hypothetical protein